MKLQIYLVNEKSSKSSKSFLSFVKLSRMQKKAIFFFLLSITGILRLQSSSAGALELIAKYMASAYWDVYVQRMRIWLQSLSLLLIMRKKMMIKLTLGGR